MTTIEIKSICNDKPLRIVEVKKPILENSEERVMVLTGKQKKPDTLSWSLMNKLPDNQYSIACQGLFKGRYADAVVNSADLLSVLKNIAPRYAAGLENALIVNSN